MLQPHTASGLQASQALGVLSTGHTALLFHLPLILLLSEVGLLLWSWETNDTKQKCGLYFFWKWVFEVVNVTLLSEIDFMNHPVQSVFSDCDFSFSTCKVKKLSFTQVQAH